MTLHIIGAGLPRTGTSSLRTALEQLLGGNCYHMSAIPGHPFDLGAGWEAALRGETPDWQQVFEGFVAAVDWPASAFWHELSIAYPNAPVLLSYRDSAESWLASVEATILPYARMGQAPDWSEKRGLPELFERFAGTKEWDHREILLAAHDRHYAAVRQTIAPNRLIEWPTGTGWEPICAALGLPIPAEPFPWSNRREDWG
ncbi:MAG: sulfotransferase [Caldilineaceae bacterium]